MRVFSPYKGPEAVSPLDSFLAIPPSAPDSLEIAQRQFDESIGSDSYDRNRLADVLFSYNEAIGNIDAASLASISKLREPESRCIVTGQQLGLMGGPSYSILKGISCLSLARQADAIPIYWLATDDHDIAEIDHTFLLDEKGNIEKWQIPLAKGVSVEDLIIDSEGKNRLEKLAQRFGIRDLFFSDDRYATAMAKVLVRLFSGSGILFLEPMLLKSQAIPFFQQQIRNADRITTVLKATTERLKSAGGRAPLAIDTAACNLFIKMEGNIRKRVLRDDNGFLFGSERCSQEEMLELITHQTDRFSTSAASRPLLQSAIIPTLGYVAGTTELAYHRQLKDYYTLCGVSMPWVVERHHATIVPPFAQELLNRSGLNSWEEMPKRYEHYFPQLRGKISSMVTEWRSSVYGYFEHIPTEQVERLTALYGSKMERKIANILLKERGIPPYAFHYLRTLLKPRGVLQERVINWHYFQATADENLVTALLQHFTWPQQGHLYCLP